MQAQPELAGLHLNTGPPWLVNWPGAAVDCWQLLLPVGLQLLLTPAPTNSKQKPDPFWSCIRGQGVSKNPDHATLPPPL